MSKKHILIPPVIIGVATLSGLLIMHFFPAPTPVSVCLRSHHETFNVHPRIDVDVDGQKKLLPDTLGKTKDGKECLRVIHSDNIGNELHVQFVRPVKLTMGDFMSPSLNLIHLINLLDFQNLFDIWQCYNFFFCDFCQQQYLLFYRPNVI